MVDSTDSLMVQMGTYVTELKAQRQAGKIMAARGSTLKIFGAIAKLRDLAEPGIEASIAMALQEAQLDFDPSTNYRNICWHCYREEGARRFLDARVEKSCPKCGWLVCFHCGQCRAPDYGGCTRSSSPAP